VAVAVAVAVAGGDGGGERPEVRVKIGVPHMLLGDYLVQSRVMNLVNAYLERSQCLASRQRSVCTTDKLICSRIETCFFCLSASAQRNLDFTEYTHR
jgi:hypothetical protein